MTLKEMYLIITEDDPNEIKNLVDHMLSGRVIDHAGFKCKVTFIEAKEVGSKQAGTYKIGARAKLTLVKRHETD